MCSLCTKAGKPETWIYNNAYIFGKSSLELYPCMYDLHVYVFCLQPGPSVIFTIYSDHRALKNQCLIHFL